MARAEGLDAITEPVIRVVLADDNPLIRTLAQRALSMDVGMAGVALAADGAAALALVAANQPDCVVLDVDMPGMGGFAALGELRRRFPDLPVVMLSGYSDPTSRAQATAAGAAAYLDKSRLVDLAQTIRRVAGGGGAPTPAGSSDAAIHGLAEDLASGRISPPEMASEDLRAFEYAVSHDLAEPLRIVSGFSGLLQKHSADALGDVGQTYLGHILDASRRMQAMVDDLLGYTRAGTSVPRVESVRLDDAVAAVVSRLSKRLDEHRAEVVVDAGLPSVNGDRDMIETMLQQLILNAVIFNQSPVPVARVCAEVRRGCVVLTVEDNGIGIDPKHRERVFALFQRLNTRDEYPGTGTGLALCRRLARLNGGAVSLDGSSGAGTTATLTLPSPTPHTEG